MGGTLIVFGGLFLIGFSSGRLADSYAKRSLVRAVILGSIGASVAAYAFGYLVALYPPEFSSGRWEADVLVSCATGTTSVCGTLLLRRKGFGIVLSAGVAALAGIAAVFVGYAILAAFFPTLVSPSWQG